MLNKMIIIGNVGGDPEMRYIPSGDAVTNFSVAVNERWGSAEDRKEKTTWFKVTAWRKLAEICNQYVTKGMSVYVEGRLSADTYDRRDGGTGLSLEINAQTVLFLSRSEDGGGQTPRQQAAAARAVDPDEEMPW